MAKNKKGKQKAQPQTPEQADEGVLGRSLRRIARLPAFHKASPTYPDLGTIPEDGGEEEWHDQGEYGNSNWDADEGEWGEQGAADVWPDTGAQGAHTTTAGQGGYDQAGRGWGPPPPQAGAPQAWTAWGPDNAPAHTHNSPVPPQNGSVPAGYAPAPAGYGQATAGYAPPTTYVPPAGYAPAPTGYNSSPAGYNSSPAGYNAAPEGWGPPPIGYADPGGWGPPPAHVPPTPMSRTTRLAQTGASGGGDWKGWAAEAAANKIKDSELPYRPRATGQPFNPARPVNQGRVAFADDNTFIPSRPELTPQAQQAILDSIQGRGGRQTSGQRQGRKSKRAKQAQEDQGWGTPRSPVQGWGQQDDPGGWEAWGTGSVDDGNGGAWQKGGGSPIDSGWDDLGGRQQYAENLANAFIPAPAGPTSYPMPSRTMAYATNNSPEMLDALKPGMAHMRNGMDDYVNKQFVDSYGDGLRDAEKALFGRERKAKDRIHWKFPHDKDPRVRSVLEWIQTMSHGLGAFGLDKFLQTRERGALFVNASYEPQDGHLEPAFDWLSYEDAVETRDRIIQESVGYYDPAMQAVVFVFLPSRTGNSVAMWRRKVTVPNSVRLAHLREIQLAKAALRKDYPVVVDELPSSTPPSVPPKKKKKKRGFFSRLFSIFKIEW